MLSLHTCVTSSSSLKLFYPVSSNIGERQYLNTQNYCRIKESACKRLEINVKDNFLEVLLHTIGMATNKKKNIKIASVGEDVEGSGILCTVGGNVHWYKTLLKTVWRFFKKFKIELPYDQAIPLLGIHPEKLKAGTQIFTPPCPEQLNSQLRTETAVCEK